MMETTKSSLQHEQGRNTGRVNTMENWKYSPIEMPDNHDFTLMYLDNTEKYLQKKIPTFLKHTAVIFRS